MFYISKLFEHSNDDKIENLFGSYYQLLVHSNGKYLSFIP